jgi:hypothetical protein
MPSNINYAIRVSQINTLDEAIKGNIEWKNICSRLMLILRLSLEKYKDNEKFSIVIPSPIYLKKY